MAQTTFNSQYVNGLQRADSLLDSILDVTREDESLKQLADGERKQVEAYITSIIWLANEIRRELNKGEAPPTLGR